MWLGMHLWQRIFICALALVLAAHTASYLIFIQASRKFESLQIMAEITADTADSVTGGTVEELRAYAKIYNTPQPKLWFEQPDGTPIIGYPVSGFGQGRRDVPIVRLEGRSTGESQNRQWFDKTATTEKPPSAYARESRFVNILETELPGAECVGTTPVVLQGRQAVLFLAFDKYRSLPVKSLFLTGLVAVVVIGGFLALWAARKLSFPLQRFRNEVLDMAAGDLSKRVSGKNEGEIGELATAVNKLADDLAWKITSGQELIANISHELRSPISRITLSAAIAEEAMRDECRRPPALPDSIGTHFKHMRIIQEETARLDRLIGSSLMSSKLDLQRDLPLFPVDFSALCQESSLSYTERMEEKELVFVRYIHHGLWVQGDEPSLCSVVSNLLDNAVKYTKPSGSVHLTLTSDRRLVQLAVENTHAFMPQEWFKLIFSPFHRGDIPTGNGEGVGLGLYLVEKIVTLHHGQVRAHNGSFGVRFVVTLRQRDEEL